MAKIKA